MTMTHSHAINIGVKLVWLSLQTLGFEMASRYLQFIQDFISGTINEGLKSILRILLRKEKNFGPSSCVKELIRSCVRSLSSKSLSI